MGLCGVDTVRILILSCGTRNKLIKYFMNRQNGFEKVIVTDCSIYAPALYEADQYYIVPKFTEDNYLEILFEICRKEHVNVVLPLQEDEILLIAQQREEFKKRNIFLAVSEYEKVKLCRDKYQLYQYLRERKIPVIDTYLPSQRALIESEISSNAFIKPRNGCGSIGAIKVKKGKLLEALLDEAEEEFVVQPYISGEEFGIDVYVDFDTKNVSGLFAKRKLRMRAGETEKSISVKDPELFKLVEQTVRAVGLVGALDVDVLKYNAKYYVLEINTRFGGGYPHAYECGVNFPIMLAQNVSGRKNERVLGEYKEGIVALKYMDVLVKGYE